MLSNKILFVENMISYVGLRVGCITCLYSPSNPISTFSWVHADTVKQKYFCSLSLSILVLYSCINTIEIGFFRQNISDVVCVRINVLGANAHYHH